MLQRPMYDSVWWGPWISQFLLTVYIYSVGFFSRSVWCLLSCIFYVCLHLVLTLNEEATWVHQSAHFTQHSIQALIQFLFRNVFYSHLHHIVFGICVGWFAQPSTYYLIRIFYDKTKQQSVLYSNNCSNNQMCRNIRKQIKGGKKHSNGERLKRKRWSELEREKVKKFVYSFEHFVKRKYYIHV